ncbi:MAG: M1 family metallopeptidase [Actinomycetota bacterium]
MDDRYRLPRSVVPNRYDLTLAPDLAAATYEGSVEIAVTVVEPVDRVVLNAIELEIDGGTLTADDGRALDIAVVELDEEHQRATLVLPEIAAPGAWSLTLAFRGVLNDHLHGFYRSTYTDDETGEKHTIATTQFEAADARRAFPCWDEPDLKAVFGITLDVPDDVMAISNGPEIAREPLEDGRVRVRFADTMVMSTYLVAFVVGRMELTPPVEVDGVPIRVAHLPGKDHLASFALDAAMFSLRFFREYYGIPYPDAKVDMVAMPDFAQGAMENTGCIIYRESALLVDPAHATQPELENIADVVAHELAHQWFGNLVTMRWWNGIWLNEAFATFMALITVDAMRPDWEVWAAFARAGTSAREVDALHSTRAIEYPVASPDDTQGMFDVLTYQKGGAILRMLERYLGADRFRDGIRRYLTLHEFGNTETHDLWDAIEEATGEPVRRIMDSWIWQGGYPLLSVEPKDDGVSITQSRFLADGSPDATVWDVPLRVRLLGGEEQSVLVTAGGATVDIPADAAAVVNAGASSFVRVRYAPELRERLVARLTEVSPMERYTLVDDLWASVAAGTASAADFVVFADAFREEDDLAVWQVLIQSLAMCDRFVEGETRERFRAFVRGLVAPALDRLGWDASDEDADRVRTLRGTLLQGLGVLGADPNAAAMAREYEAESRAGKDIDPALAAAAVNVVAVAGDADDYERYVDRSLHAATPQEQLRYQLALPQFRDAALLDRTFAAVLDGTIRSQDAPFVVAYSVMNRDLGHRSWEFLKANWDELTGRFPGTLWVRMADGLRFLNEPGDPADAAAFFEDHPIPQSAKTLEQILERQRVLAALRERAEPDLAARFAD